MVAALSMVSGTALASPTWTVQSVPEHSGGSQSALEAVSCPSTTVCTAGGGYVEKFWGALAEEWKSGSWSAGSAVPNPGSKNGFFLSISCASTTECVASGDYGTTEGIANSLVENKEGMAWKVKTSTNPGHAGDLLQAISCWEASYCTSVGQDAEWEPCGAFCTRLFWGALGEVWKGAGWNTLFYNLNPGVRNGTLHGISCVSELNC